MINHLRDKHNITKDNYTRYLDEHSEVGLLIYYIIEFNKLLLLAYIFAFVKI